MASENLGKTITLAASTDLSSYQDRFVKTSSGQVALCGDGQDAIGILQNDPAASGREATVALDGIAKVVVGGTCTVDGYGASDSAGRAVNAVSGDYKLCRFLETATVAGSIVRVILLPGPHPIL